MRDLDELLGDTPKRRDPPIVLPSPNRRGRPRKSEISRIDPLLGNFVQPREQTLNEPVSIPWLMKMFRMSRTKVEAAVASCEPIGFASNGGAYYDLPEVAACLVTSKKDVRAFFKDLKPTDLPPRLRESFWAAKLKEQKFRVQAGRLWPSQSVIEVFGETFKTIKSTTQLWVDTVEETTGVTKAQRETLTKLVDVLLDDIHQALVLQSRSNVTPSQLAELDDDPELNEL